MDKSSRRLKILDILQSNGSVDVNELAQKFQSSEMTIRRDLNDLAKQYNVIRTHGGAVTKERDTKIIKSISFYDDKITNKEAKSKIAQTAASFIQPRQRIFIDAGSTTRGIVHYLNNELKTIVVSNSIEVVESCMHYENISVIMLGGEMLRISRCSFGKNTEHQLLEYQFDVAFLGAAAIGTDGKVYDGYSPEASFKNKIFDVTKKVYLLVDSSKFNTYDLIDFADLNQFYGLITDTNVNAETELLLKRKNVKLIIAKS